MFVVAAVPPAAGADADALAVVVVGIDLVLTFHQELDLHHPFFAVVEKLNYSVVARQLEFASVQR